MAKHVEKTHENNSQCATAASAFFTTFLLLGWCLSGAALKANAQIVLPGSGDIDTVVGTGAGLYFPRGVAVDSSGNIYIADSGNAVIRKVTASTGNVSTVAGNGSGGYSGDGGPATSAEISSPHALALDSSGNIYLGDSVNDVVRKVTVSTGYISTVAGNGSVGYSGDGGVATSAKLDNPAYLAVDGSGNLYISDAYNYVIREVVASTGFIYTVAGGGSPCVAKTDVLGDGCQATDAVLAEPEGVATDASGNLYIADAGWQTIREVSASTGIISSVVGTPNSFGFSGDGAAAGSAEMNSPFDLKFDASGNLYIADTGNQRIRKVTASTGYISTIAGNGSAGYAGDGGAATSAELDNPEYVAVDSSGNVYLTDTNNFVIRAVAH